ncbi:MAG: VOC family protein [Burkholderiales bacterium]|nr:VOC family protein [Burkholderiales bacterium]
MTMRIRQIVFAAADLAATRAQLKELLALDAPYADPGVGEFGLDNAVFALGDQFIEIVSPITGDTACGRHLVRRGDSGYMVILQTDDIDEVRSRMQFLGVRAIWQKDLDDIRAMHLHPKDIGGSIVSIDEPRPPASWRWGGPDWRVQDGAAGRQRVVGVTIEAHDPGAMARRWAEVLGLGAAHEEGALWRLPLHEGVIDFVRADARGEGVAGYTLAVADPAAVLQRARRLALVVSGQNVRLMGVEVGLRSLDSLGAERAPA